MNILFCYRNWMNPKIGGVQKVSDTLAKYLIKNGFTVYYLNFLKDSEDKYNFPVKIFNLPDDQNFYSKKNIKYYHNLINQLSIDIIINHDASNNRSKLWLNTGDSAVKKISLYHTDPTYGINKEANFLVNLKNKKIKGFLTRILSKPIKDLKIQRRKIKINFLLKKSDKLILLSVNFISNIHQELKIKSPKIHSINNPCIISEISVNNKAKHVLFVARMEIHHKRPDKMLIIWKLIQNEHPEWKLILLGDGKDRIRIEQLAKKLELKNVEFKGFVNPEPYYQSSSIICMTSDYEGFGLVLIEGMQYGLVPIAFNNWGSLSDIIINNQTGIMISSNDMEGYKNKLSLLMKNEDFRNTLSFNARSSVKKFSIDHIGQQWIDLFNLLIQ